VLGVVALVALDEGGHSVGDASPLLFGLAIVLVISFAPSGLVGLATAAVRRLRRGSEAPMGERQRAVTGAALEEAAASVEQAESRHEHRLVVGDVSVQFEGLLALKDVSFELRSGEIVGLIGPNGAGKTSTVNVMTGRVIPTTGHVYLDGRELTGLKPFQIAQAGVVRTFQSTRLIPTFDLITNVMLSRHDLANATVTEQILALPRSVADGRAAREEAMRLLRIVGVETLAEVQARDLPYGVQRRAEIAKALALRPTFLLLDEPGAGLSSFERDEVAEAISAVARHGVGCLLIDHNIPFVARVCSRLVVLSAGEILLEGEATSVLSDTDVIEAYLGAAAVKA
jgi:branched-chain amino acid transport system permease protein